MRACGEQANAPFLQRVTIAVCLAACWHLPHMALRRYEDIRPIGRGSFGTATLARVVPDADAGGAAATAASAAAGGTPDELVVIKRVPLTGLTEGERTAARREAQILAHLRHPCVIRHIESYEADGFLCVVTELAERGDLAHALAARRGVWLPEDEVLEYAVSRRRRRRLTHASEPTPHCADWPCRCKSRWRCCTCTVARSCIVISSWPTCC